MTEVVDAKGRRFAATVVEVGPCMVSQLKTEATDGYDAVQVTFGRRRLSRVSKPLRGHFAKANVAPGVVTREFERAGEGELKVGQAVNVGEVFKVGDVVDVEGVSKGKGYAGVIKRHGFAGFPASRGTHEYFRHGGSIGNRSFPGRVFKGLRMAGQMGNRKVTIGNLRVCQVMPEDNAVVILGAAPGADGSLLIVKHAAKQRKSTEQSAKQG
jgi:large subunit ribosomal protein L3